MRRLDLPKNVDCFYSHHNNNQKVFHRWRICFSDNVTRHPRKFYYATEIIHKAREQYGFICEHCSMNNNAMRSIKELLQHNDKNRRKDKKFRNFIHFLHSLLIVILSLRGIQLTHLLPLVIPPAADDVFKLIFSSRSS